MIDNSSYSSRPTATFSMGDTLPLTITVANSKINLEMTLYQLLVRCAQDQIKINCLLP